VYVTFVIPLALYAMLYVMLLLTYKANPTKQYIC